MFNDNTFIYIYNIHVLFVYVHLCIVNGKYIRFTDVAGR